MPKKISDHAPTALAAAGMHVPVYDEANPTADLRVALGRLAGLNPEGNTEYAQRTFAGTIAPDAHVTYAAYTQSGALTFAKGAGAFNGASHILPFNSNGGALGWGAGFVAAHSLAAANLPTSLPAGLNLLVFTYHGQRNEILVSWARVLASEVAFAAAGGIAATTVQAAVEELAAEKLSYPDAGGAEIGNYRPAERTITAAGSVVAADSGKELVVTAALTLTVPAAATLGAKCRCMVWNVSGGNVVLDGPGSTNVTLAAGELAEIAVVNNAVRVAKGATTVIS